MHKQSFWFGKDLGVYLVKGVNVQSTAGLLAVCIFVGSMAFAFEYLRYLQTKSKQRELKLRAKQIKMLCPTESSKLLAQTVSNPRNPLNITLFDRAVLFGTDVSLWILLQNLGYLIMLSVMLYDAWLLVSAVIGGGLGYFLFGYKFMKINMDNCRIIRDTYCTQICAEAAFKAAESTPVAESPSTSHSDLECHKGGQQKIVSVNIHSECQQMT